MTDGGLSGMVGGFAIEVRRDLTPTGRNIEVTIEGDAATPIPPAIEIAAHGLLAGKDLLVGDPAFDARFSVDGDAATAMAILDAEARQALLAKPDSLHLSSKAGGSR